MGSKTTLATVDLFYGQNHTETYFLHLLCYEKKGNHTSLEYLFSAGDVVQEKEVELVAHEGPTGSGISSPTPRPPNSLKLKRCYQRQYLLNMSTWLNASGSALKLLIFSAGLESVMGYRESKQQYLTFSAYVMGARRWVCITTDSLFEKNSD